MTNLQSSSVRTTSLLHGRHTYDLSTLSFDINNSQLLTLSHIDMVFAGREVILYIAVKLYGRLGWINHLCNLTQCLLYRLTGKFQSYQKN